MKRINVMHLRSIYVREGGPERIILSIAQKMDQAKFNVILTTLQSPAVGRSDFLNSANALGIKVECIFWNRFKSFLVGGFKIAALIKKHNIDILHTHDPRSDLVGLIAGKLRNIVIITSAHGWLRMPLKIRIYEFADKLFIRFFDKIIVGSEAMRNKVRDLLISSQKIDTVYNSVDLTRLPSTIPQKDIKTQFGLNCQAPIIGVAGRLSKEKGQEFLLMAAPMVLKTFPEAKFLIIGEGSMKNQLQFLAKKLNISQNVIFTGFYENITEILTAIDIFVLPSLTESLPVVMLEAMALGKPVIATAVGGVEEAIIDGKTGLLVEPKKPVALAETINKILQNKQKAKQMAREAKCFVKEKFDSALAVKKIEEIYLKALAEKQ